MSDWLKQLRAWRQANGEPAVVVTIESTKGSVPRPTGTRMLVTRDAVIGTIGGGHLEWTAIDVARGRLGSPSPSPSPSPLPSTSTSTSALSPPSTSESPTANPHRQRFVLGASLGQCCGGIACVTFETITPPLDDNEAADALERWFEQSSVSTGFPIVLFGAGHVGRAVASILGQIPCTLTWVDARDDAFPADVASNTRVVITDAAEAEVDAAPPGASFLVMTHAHALDQAVTERILARNDFAYFGLIGSMTKRRQFERRLEMRGVDPERFKRMTCPIGIDGIEGKEPGVIAVAVVAEVLREHARWIRSREEDVETVRRTAAAQ